MNNYLIGLTLFFCTVGAMCAPKEEKNMGQYITNIDGERIGTTFDEKCRALQTLGAVPVEGDQFEKDLVCVVDNGPFAAAGYAFNNREFEEFKSPCGRRKQWFTLANAAEHVD